MTLVGAMLLVSVLAACSGQPSEVDSLQAVNGAAELRSGDLTIFGSTVPPGNPDPDSAAVELGLRFRSDVAGTVTAIRFYKHRANTGTHTGSLWSSSGERLATVTFSGETSKGWQQARLSNPVSIQPGTAYVVSYFAPKGRYAVAADAFAKTGKDTGPLHALRDGEAGANGLYSYGSDSSFPTSSWRSANYYVDVVFRPAAVQPLAAPAAAVTTTTAPTPTTAAPTTAAPTTTAPTTTTPVAPSAPPSGFPSPSTTGWQPTGVSLAAYTGPTDITTPGTVIDSKDITSCLRISASNVTIKRSRIRCAGDFGIYLPNGSTGLLVEDTEITSTSPTNRADWGIATWGGGATLRRLYIHGTQRGWNVGSNSVLEDSYIGQNVNPTDLHTNAIMSSGGADNVVIRRNTLRSEAGTYATSAIAMFPENWAGGANSNVTITNNLLAGGSYCTYLGHGPGESPNTGFTFTGNQFSTSVHADCGLYGPVHAWDAIAGNVWSNNTWADGPKAGQIVNP